MRLLIATLLLVLTASTVRGDEIPAGPTRATSWVYAPEGAAVVIPWSVKVLNRVIDETNFVVAKGCSGTLIDTENRHVLTAAHCVASLEENIERDVVQPDGTIETMKARRLRDTTVSQHRFDGAESVQTVSYRVRIVSIDKVRDLALLKILAPIPLVEPARLACEDPQRGEQVWVVGNPLGRYAAVTQGIVSSVQRTYESADFDEDFDGHSNAKQPVMQISGGVVPGNSGGAVYLGNGHLVGVPVFGNRVYETQAFAVPVSQVHVFLSNAKAQAPSAHCQK